MAFGYQAPYANVSGSYNTAVGTYALVNATGDDNNAQDYSALFNTTTGSVNTAQGFQALFSNTTGTHNIGIGYQAGYYQTTGSYNIYLGNSGAAPDSGVIRIGDPNAQSAAYLAGVAHTNITGGVTVVVNSNGQLGVVSSSRPYKEDIQPMAGASERLLKLRPVSFRYRKANDAGEKAVQYGLIAEEVAEVFPELVVNNARGQPETVAYQVLPALLLNELQKDHAQMETQEQKLATQAAELGELRQRLAELDTLRAEMAELRRLTVQLVALNKRGGRAGCAARRREIAVHRSPASRRAFVPLKGWSFEVKTPPAVDVPCRMGPLVVSPCFKQLTLLHHRN